MENKYFDCVVKMEDVQDNGNTAVLTEHYLVKAVDFTSAEKITLETVGVQPDDIKKTKVCMEPVSYVEDGEYWYYVTAAFIQFDEATEKEKVKKSVFAVKANDVTSAIAGFNSISDGFGDFRILSVVEKSYIDYLTDENED